MVSALTRKSLKDLSRRRARTVFTVLTVAFGVAGLGMMAIEDLADRGMADQISSSRMYNIRINVEDVALNATNLRELGELPNVKDVEPRAIARGKMYIGERRVHAVIIGDEPTGNLDSATEGKMFDIIKSLSERGKTIVYVTHSQKLADRANRRIRMLDGRIVEG